MIACESVCAIECSTAQRLLLHVPGTLRVGCSTASSKSAVSITFRGTFLKDVRIALEMQGEYSLRTRN